METQGSATESPAEPPPPEPTPSLFKRLRALTKRTQDRIEVERGRHNSLDAVLEMVDRNAEVAGGIIAGALAYRLFIWLLPLGLVMVAGLGIGADAASTTPAEAADKLGLAGLVSASILDAASSSSRWYALLVGIPILLWASSSVLRVLIGAHRLIWRDVRAAAPKTTLPATVRLLGLLLCFPAISIALTAIRGWSGAVGVLATLLAVLPFAVLWLIITLPLPHRGARWMYLVPGSVFFAFGLVVLQALAAYFLAPYLLTKSGTYGALGIAGVLLLGLFFLAEVIVGAAVIDATLWERARRGKKGF